MAHYPTRRAPLWDWLPAPCACGARRFDRCPDAVAAALNGGHGAPLAAAVSEATLHRIARGLAGEQAPARNDRRWWSA